MSTWSRLLVLAALCGCSGNNPGGGDGGGGGGDMAGGGNDDMGGGPGSPDLALPPGTMTVRLIASTYTLAPGVEKYQCERLTIPNDMYIVRVTPVSPSGVHHEVLAIDNKSSPDGTSSCSGGAVAATKNLYASGINSPALSMPSKVALKINAGEQIQLNLHLLNASTTQTLNATAAIDVVVAMDGTGYELAGVPFAGKVLGLTARNNVQVGTCTVSNDTKFFAVFPHMHEVGKHIKIVAGTTTVWDDDYNFMDQKFGFYPNWPATEQEISLKKGDKITVTCTYGETPDMQPRMFGESTHDEMCFGISYVHPTIATTLGTAFCQN